MHFICSLKSVFKAGTYRAASSVVVPALAPFGFLLSVFRSSGSPSRSFVQMLGFLCWRYHPCGPTVESDQQLCGSWWSTSPACLRPGVPGRVLLCLLVTCSSWKEHEQGLCGMGQTLSLHGGQREPPGPCQIGAPPSHP